MPQSRSAPSAWTFEPEPSRMHTPCDTCHKIRQGMFYKLIRHPSGAYSTTKAQCGPCLYRKDNEKPGSKKGGRNPICDTGKTTTIGK